jgi:hypothetical protein
LEGRFRPLKVVLGKLATPVTGAAGTWRVHDLFAAFSEEYEAAEEIVTLRDKTAVPTGCRESVIVRDVEAHGELDHHIFGQQVLLSFP